MNANCNSNRLLFVIFLACMVIPMGTTACSTVHGDGQIRAQSAVDKIKQAKSAIENSNMPTAQKKATEDLLDSAADETTQLGSDVDHNASVATDAKAEAAKYKEDSHILHWIISVGVIALILLVVYFFREQLGSLAKIMLSGGIAK